MIISDEQVRLALEYMHTASSNRRCADGALGCSPDFVERVRREIASTPEVRDDRLVEARRMIDEGGFDSGEIAGKMIGRAISDSLR
jgi:hypothetical protein